MIIILLDQLFINFIKHVQILIHHLINSILTSIIGRNLTAKLTNL